MFIFDGGRLDEESLASLRFRDGELDQFRFVATSELAHFTIERLTRRIRESLEARRIGAATYLEHGGPPIG